MKTTVNTQENGVRSGSAQHTGAGISLPAVNPFNPLVTAYDEKQKGEDLKKHGGVGIAGESRPVSPNTNTIPFITQRKTQADSGVMPGRFNPSFATQKDKVVAPEKRSVAFSFSAPQQRPVTDNRTFPVQFVAKQVIQLQPTEIEIADAKALLKTEIERGDRIMTAIAKAQIAQKENFKKYAQEQAIRAAAIRAEIGAAYTTSIKDLAEGQHQGEATDSSDDTAAPATSATAGEPASADDEDVHETDTLRGDTDAEAQLPPEVADRSARGQGTGKFKMETETNRSPAAEERRKAQLEKYRSKQPPLPELKARNQTLGLYHNEFDLASGELTAKDNANNAEMDLKNNQFMSYQLHQLSRMLASREQRMSQLTALVRTGIINTDSLKVIKTLRKLYPKQADFDPVTMPWQFQALLGTPNGNTAGYMVADNGVEHNIFGIEKISILGPKTISVKFMGMPVAEETGTDDQAESAPKKVGATDTATAQRSPGTAPAAQFS